MTDKIVFSLSDQSGELRFERFAAVGAPELEPTVEALQAYLLGRPLREIDIEAIAGMIHALDDRSRSELLGLFRHLKQACSRSEEAAPVRGGQRPARSDIRGPAWRQTHAETTF